MPQRLLKFIPTGDRLMERLTDLIASIGVLTWLAPGLYEWTASVSQFAALIMPILGAIWLGVQIWAKVFKGK
jgi:hypothetical protein